MAKTINTEIMIEASPEKIWALLTDFEQYSTWNPFIRSIDGSVEVGNKITVTIQPSDGSAMTFRPTVLSKIVGKELSWLGSVLFKGLFDGRHTFELIPQENGSTRFVHREVFSGIFVFLFNTEKTENGFHAMNKQVKALAENS